MNCTKTLKHRLSICLFPSLIILTGLGPFSTIEALGSDRSEGSNITELELQEMLMAFADRFASIILQGYQDFEMAAQLDRTNLIAYGDSMYSTAAAITIAAEPNPRQALLDMVVMVTMGRIIWETYWLPRIGAPAKILVERFRQMEKDIWSITGKVLGPEDQEDLRRLIGAWLKEHPEQNAFSYIRFRNFEDYRFKMKDLSKAPSWFLKSVQEATVAVDEMRLLSERAIYLGTRMPLLAGGFADLWLTTLLTNRKFKKILEGVDKVSNSTIAVTEEVQKLPERFANERDKTLDMTMERVEKLREQSIDQIMTRLSTEREAAIKQFMDGIADERKSLIRDLTSEDEGLRGTIREIKAAMEVGNPLISELKDITESLNTFVERLKVDSENSEPFRIDDYRETAAQVSLASQQARSMIESAERLLGSPGFNQVLPRIVEVLDRAEKEAGELTGRIFHEAIWLILIFLAGMVAALLVYRYAAMHLFETRQGSGRS